MNKPEPIIRLDTSNTFEGGLAADLSLDKETLKDLETQADGSEAAKGGLGAISLVLCISRDCVTQGCLTK